MAGSTKKSTAAVVSESQGVTTRVVVPPTLAWVGSIGLWVVGVTLLLVCAGLTLFGLTPTLMAGWVLPGMTEPGLSRSVVLASFLLVFLAVFTGAWVLLRRAFGLLRRINVRLLTSSRATETD